MKSYSFYEVHFHGNIIFALREIRKYFMKRLLQFEFVQFFYDIDFYLVNLKRLPPKINLIT